MGGVKAAARWIRRVLNLGEPQYALPNTTGYTPGRHRIGEVLTAAEAVSTLFSVVDLLASSTARVDWHLYRKSVDGRRVYGPAEDNRVEVTQHQALRVFNKPNTLMTRMELIERTQQHIDLAGEAFWLIEKTSRGAIPTGIWPLRPDRMNEVISDQGLIGWTYRTPQGELIPYTLDEIVHIQLPNPSNMYRGLSPVRALATDLEATTQAAAYSAAYFRNSAAPSGVILAPNELGDREFDRVVSQWRDRHQGVANAHRVALLENGLDFKDTTTRMRDMQFVELRGLSREMIREAYRVHPHKLGLSGDVNLANAYAADTTFAKDGLTVRLERIKQALNFVFLPMFGGTGENVEFCYDDPTPEDRESENAERKSKVDAAVALIHEGANPASALKALGLPPIEWDVPSPGPTAPQVAPVSPAPASAPTGTMDAEQAALAARLVREAFA